MYPNNDKFKFIKRVDGRIELKFRNTSLDFCIAFGSIRIHAKYFTPRMRDEYVPETLVSVGHGSRGMNQYDNPWKTLKVDACGDVMQVLAGNYKMHVMNRFSIGARFVGITVCKGPWRRHSTMHFDRPEKILIRRRLNKMIRGESINIDENTVDLLLYLDSQVMELTSQGRKPC